MHRFFVTPGEGRGGRVTLDERESHHAARVLRIEPGEEVELLDGAGGRLRGRVARVGKRAVEVDVLGREPVPELPRVILVPALIKGRGMDFLVQKATELGATEIWPTMTTRTVVHVAPGEAEGKVGGWRETAMEACKQCGNPWLPRLAPPRTLGAVLKELPADGVRLVASLEPGARWPDEILEGAGPASEGVLLFTGPEGDFTADEYALLRAAGVVPMTLGPLVLRAETAVLAALAVVQHALRRRVQAGRSATTPSGGSRSGTDWAKPCMGSGSEATAPPLPTSDPP